jgi:non-specific serine/threonine protein kinase/serine/threonine-protein kinase
MELVRGVPLTEFCDRSKLPMKERLELFRKVCSGVQHAHQKAIIHRDLKPSNVLVTTDGDEAIPKIIDFGIAKAVASPLTDMTLFTRIGQLVGTPEYMSPEQAEGGVQEIDTRSDVYSLGVLLYELLVGTLPFDPKSLRAQGIEAIHRIIREVDPPKPSTRVSSLSETDTDVAAVRSTDLRNLRSELAGDLDWITMKALEKSPSRRYDSPSQMSDDIERYLSDQPVLASPPSAAYRMRKFLRRHRVGAVASAAVLLSLLVGVAAAVWGFVDARASERRALHEAETAQQVSDFLVELFDKADPDRTRGDDLRVREVLDAGVLSIRSGLEDQPETRAAMLETLGRVYTALGEYDDARPMLEEAVSVFGSAASNDLRLPRAQARLAQVIGWQGDYEQAVEQASKAVDRLQASVDRARGDAREERLQLASALNVLAVGQANLGRLDEAQAGHERALAIREELLPEVDEQVSQSVHNLAIVHHFRGDYERAAELYQRAAEIEKAVGGDRTPGYATSLHTLAIVRQSQGRFDEAIRLEEESLEIRRQALGPAHPHVSFSLTTLAQLFAETGRSEEAEALFRQAIAVGSSAWSPLYPEVIMTRRGLAELLASLNRASESSEILSALLSELEAAGPEVERFLPRTFAAHGRVLLASGATRAALDEFEQALAQEQRISGEEHPYVLEALLPLVEPGSGSPVRNQRCQLAGEILSAGREKAIEAVGSVVVEQIESLCP